MYDINNIPNGILDDNESRNKEIIDILQLKEDSIFTDSLIEIITAYKENKIDTITAYQYINSILGRYYYCVTMPKEDEELRRKRENKSLVSIYNTNDIVEVTIKKNLYVNQVFPDGITELINTIGVEKLEFYDGNNELITSIEKLCGGKQREKIKKYLEQYIKICKRPDIKRYAIQIEEIYKKPKYTMFYSRSEKNGGYYIDKFIPFLTGKLLQENRRIFRTTVNQIAEIVHLVNYRYNRYSLFTDDKAERKRLLLKLQNQNSYFTDYQLRQFYKNSNKEVRDRIYKVLDNLQDEYKAITYKKTHTIFDENGNHIADDFEDDIIQDGEAEILNNMGIRNISTIFLKKLSQKFYSDVIEYINDKYELNWKNYRNEIEIRITNFIQLENLYKDYQIDKDEQMQNITAIKSRFIKRLGNMAQTDYDKKMKKYQDSFNAEVEKNKQAYKKSDLYDIGILTDKAIEEKAIKDVIHDELTGTVKLEYKPYDNYVEIQKALIKYLIDFVK